MPKTASDAYPLPGPVKLAFGNAVLRLARFVPSIVSDLYLRRYRPYQTTLDTDPEEMQGDSDNKWSAIAACCEVKGLSFLDIGCAEGFFCRAALRDGATRAVGVDIDFQALLAASFLGRRDGLRARYVGAVFPDIPVKERFDCVLCVSVLHHFVKTDMWTTLTDPTRTEDLQLLRSYLGRLCRLVAPGGRCVIEVPYHYSEAAQRDNIDFSRLVDELLLAGFSTAEQRGTWDYATRFKAEKARILYVAQQ